jgi:hypothetical protein
MQYVDYTNYNEAVSKTAKDLGISEKVVDSVYKAYCKLIINKLSTLPLKEDLTEEEFNKLQTNINLPSLGKIYCTWKTYIGEKKRVEYVQKTEKNKTAKYRYFSNNESL